MKVTLEHSDQGVPDKEYSLKIKLSGDMLANLDEMKQIWKLSTRSELIEQLIKKVFSKSESDGSD